MEILRLQIVLRVRPEVVLRLGERIKVGFPEQYHISITLGFP